MKNLVIARRHTAEPGGRHVEYRLLIIGFRSVHLVVGTDDFGIVNVAICRGLFVEKRIERDNGTQNNREGDERRHDNAYDNRGRLALGPRSGFALGRPLAHAFEIRGRWRSRYRRWGRIAGGRAKRRILERGMIGPSGLIGTRRIARLNGLGGMGGAIRLFRSRLWLHV